MTRALLLVALSCVAACSDDRATVLVRFLSQRAIPEQASTLEVVVLSADDSVELERRSYDLTALSAFPATLELVRGDATPSRIRAQGTLSQAGEVVAWGSRDHDFATSASAEIDISLVDIPRVRSSASGTVSSAAALVIDKPAQAEAGDVLIAVMAHDSGTQFMIPAPPGWTYESALTETAGFGPRTYVFWKLATAAEPASYTFTPSPAYSYDMAGGIWSIAAADSTDPIHASAVAALASSSASATAPSITTSLPTLLLYACAKSNVATQFTPPVGMLEDWDRTSSTGSLAMSATGAHELVLAVGATGERSSSSSSQGSGYVALVLAVAPDSSALSPMRPASTPSAARAESVLLE